MRTSIRSARLSQAVLAGALGLGWALAASAQASVAEGQERICRAEETWGDCLDRVRSELAALGTGKAKNAEDMLSKAKTAVTKEAAARSQGALAGLEATGNAAAKRSFLPAFLASLGIDGLSEQNGALAFRYNSQPAGWAQWSLEALAKPPEVFSMLKAKIPEASRDKTVSGLKSAAGDFDDFEANLTLNIRGYSDGTAFSRKLGDYDQSVGEGLFELAAAESGAQQSAHATIRFNELSAGIADLPTGTTWSLNPALAANLEEQLLLAADQTIGSARTLGRILKERKYFRLVDLAANQPQLYFSAAFKVRDEVVGTDSQTFKGTFEWPLGPNINRLRNSAGCQGKPVDYECYEAYLDAIDKNAGKQLTDHRLKIEAMASEESEYNFAIPDLGVSLHIDRVTSVSASLTYGFTFRRDDEGKAISKFDLSSMYEDVSGDPMRNNRWVTTASVSQKLTNDLDFAISAIYANDPIYRGEVDKELSAKAGLRFKFDRKTGS